MLRFAFLAALLLAPAAHAQTVADSARAAWLAERLVDVESPGAADLIAATVLGQRPAPRVVALGEATHGDGAAFVVRDSLTRALHRRGIGALGLEAAGLYDLPRVPAPAEEMQSAVDASAPWLWRSSAQALPGLRYAASTVGTPGALLPVGIDVQHGPESGARLLDDAERALSALGVLDDRWGPVRATFEAAFANPFAPADEERRGLVREVVAEYDRAILAVHERAVDVPDPRVSYGLRSALAHAEVMWQRSMAPRDRQMAANATGLALERRTVIWAATSHVARRLAAIDTLDPEWTYDGTVTMGDGIAEFFGERYYVVAFTACGGAYGAEPIGLERTEIGPPEPGSLEALVCAAPFKTAAYLDLRSLAETAEGAWLNAPLVARPLGYGAQRASWPLVVDGLVVVREMTPSTPSELAEE